VTDLIPITFDEALALTATQTRELLLGNGFSIAANAKFTYRSLFERAQLSGTLRDTFEILETTDFEVVLRHLDQAASAASAAEREAIIRDRDALREALVATVAEIHPKHRKVMDENRYEACRRFLAHFIGRKRPRGGRVFTTNYDLLLYWAIIPETSSHPQSRNLRCEDGFMFGFDAKRVPSLDIVYLHGSLAYFETPNGVEKIRYRPGEQMIYQIQRNLDFGYYPVFVSEGTSQKKTSRISQNDYLRYARRKFQNACRQRDASLFTVGHSLSESDAHITDSIGTGRIKQVFLGVHGAPDSQSWRDANAVAGRWHQMRIETDHRTPLEVYAFNTSELSIWR